MIIHVAERLMRNKPRAVHAIKRDPCDDVSADHRAVNRKAIVSAFPSRFTEVEGRSKFGVEWARLMPHLSFDRSAEPPTAARDDLDAALEAAGLDRLPSGSFYSNLLHFAAVNTGMEAVFKKVLRAKKVKQIKAMDRVKPYGAESVRQHVTSLDELYARAREVLPAFKEQLPI